MLFSDAPELGVFDLETTGVDVERDRTVTAFVGRMNPRTGVIERSRSWLVNPGIPIPEQAAEVHGVTTEVANEKGMDPAAATAQIVAELRAITANGSPIVGYNLGYDFSLLDREARRYGLEPFEPTRVVDPYIIDKQMDKYRRGKRQLTITCAHYNIDLVGAHDSEADASATGLLAIEVMKLPGVPQDLDELHARQIEWAAAQAASLQSYFRSPKAGERQDPNAVVDGRWPVRKPELLGEAAA